MEFEASNRPRELRVIRLGSNEIVHTVNVSGRGDRDVEKVIRGMLRNMDTDRFHVEDSKDDKL